MFQVKLVTVSSTDVPYYVAGASSVYTTTAGADIIYNSTLQAGYEQLTDINVIYELFLKNWGDFATKEIPTLANSADKKRIDWKFVRDYIKGIVNTVGFSNLSSPDKIVAAKCNIGTKQEQESVLNSLSIQERQSISFNYDFHVEAARGVRASEVIGALWQFTGHLLVPSTPFPIPAYILVNLITINTPAANEVQGGLIDLFKSKGLQGIHTANDGLVGIYDFIQSTAGTRFETTGLDTNVGILASGTPSGFADWTAFKDYIFDIIHNGNY